MGKLDKKVLKVITTQEDMDYDVDDISIALKCDDMEVQEALDSLKDQGLIEAVIHNGKKFWKPARAESFLNADLSQPGPRAARDDSDIDLLILEQPTRPPKQQENAFQRPQSQPQRTFTSIPQTSKQQFDHEEAPPRGQFPVKRSFDVESVDDNTRIFSMPAQPVKPKPSPVEDKPLDDDFDLPKRQGSPLGIMAVAVLISAGVSAMITFALNQNVGKGFNDAVASLEAKTTEAGLKLNQRIEALSVKVNALEAKSAVLAANTVGDDAQLKAPPPAPAAKPIAKKAAKPSKPAVKKSSSKRAAVSGSSKNKKTAAEIIQETSAAANASEASSVSSPAPEATSATSAERATMPSATTESAPAATSEPSPAPSVSEPATPAASSGGVWESGSSPSSSSEGSGQ